ncbi:MAG TPA: cation:proton antiporter [Verrucomicrobiae bacterium]|nr:cation:proton antiporter [Verrucomicrobiae bacterium]
MPLLTSLLCLIVSARLLGGLFAKYKQPSIVGEMIAGVLLGPAVFNVVHATPPLQGISDLAVFLVVLSAGLEMNFKDVIKAMSGKGLVVALLGFVIPLSAGLGIGVLFKLDVTRTVFLGLCISITALPVAVRILDSFKMLNSEIARYAVVTAIINDVAALLVLGVILGLPRAGSALDVAKGVLFTGGKLVIFATLVWAFGSLLAWVERKGIAVHRVPERLVAIFGAEALFGIVVLLVLVFASVSEMLGFHFVIGAFFGALLINKDLFLASRYSELEKTLNSVTGGFLAPVFFAYLGLEFNITKMNSPEFVIAVFAVSVGAKILAGWLGGRLIRLSNVDSLGIGIILNGRGVMELVIASIAFQHGLIGEGLFSTLILMGVVTTILTPVLFRKFVLPHVAPVNGTAQAQAATPLG